MSMISGVHESQLPNPRGIGDQVDQIAADKRRNYEVVQVILNASTSSGVFPQDSPAQQMPGDEITLLELVGASAVGVKLGKSQKFIPLREGEKIRREFQEFKVRNLSTVAANLKVGWPNLPALQVVATFLVGWGPIIETVPKRFGFVDNFPIWRGTATASGVNVVDQILAVTGWSSDNAPMPGKNGGTIMIRNLDLAVTMYLYNGAAGSFDPAGVGLPNVNTAWQLGPGETLTLDLKGRCARLCAATLAGTCAFNVMADAWGDLTDSTSGRISLV